ncbi:MAG: hypothetical protein ACM31C_34230 [Acidobacteriota bacterium]
MRHFALAAAVLVAIAGDAAANGRAPATSTIHFRQGHDSDVVAGMTFGMVISHDAGATWQWMCETAIGYAGNYDPDYVYSPSGALFATTFDGLVVNRDSCTFAATTFGTTFMSQIEQGPDATLYACAADPNDATIYKSTNDGTTFSASAQPGQNGDWWSTIVIAPGNANDVYLSGYRLTPACDAKSVTPFAACDPSLAGVDCSGCTKPQGKCILNDAGGGTCDANSATPGASCMIPQDCDNCTNPLAKCDSVRVALLFASTNAGASFQPLPGNGEFLTQTTGKGLTTTANSAIDLVGTSADGSTLYARVEQESPTAEGLYKIAPATDTTWTHILTVNNDNIAALVRSNGDLVVGTRASGGQISTNGGTSWTPLTNPPHINCLVENSAHEIWACTQQLGNMNSPGDGFGIMKTTDLATWTGVLKYPDIQQPVSCAAGTLQHDACQAQIWCGLKTQLAITSTAVDCTTPPDAGVVVKPPKKTGCCDTGGSGGASALLLALATLLLVRRRRSRLG